MRIKYILIVISFLSLFVTASGVENYETFDESYAEIRCGQLRNSFFPMRYDGENEKVFIGVTALFYFLELYDVETDLDKLTVSYTVKGEKKKIKLDERNAFVLDDELYVEMDTLKKKFDFRNITFDYSMLTLSLIPNFLLPNEERAQGKIDRLRFDAQKDEDTKDDYIIMGRKVLTPGFVKLNYYSYDFPKYDNLSYEYGNQFLYGSLYLNGDLKDGDIVNYGNLTYDDILGENDLVLGNIYMDKPHFINASSDVIGISLNNERTYFFRDSGMTIIKGEAEGAETVELYTGSFLLDYIHPTSKNFEFKISDGSMSDSYIMKIYYADGKYEERKVFSINDLNILQKGKNKINMQIGKESKTGHEQGNFVLYYGLTDNLTAGVGYGMLTSPSGKKFDFFRNNILFNSRHKIAPTLIEFKNYYEMNSNENNYNIILTQKYKKMQMKVAHEKYSEYIYNENSIKEYNSLSLGRTFNRNYVEVGLEEKYYLKYEKSRRKNMYLYWNSYSFNPFYLSVKMDKSLEEESNEYGVYPTISYYGFFTTILEGGFEKDGRGKWKDYYSLKLDKRDVKIIQDKLYGDIGIFVRYSPCRDMEKLRYGISFSVKFDDFIYMRTTTDTRKSQNSKSETITGLEVTKVFDLGSPAAQYDNRSSVTNASIHGKIYLDKNSNDIFDEGDIPIEGACVLIDGSKFYSNENGDYIANGIATPTVVSLEVDRKTIDPMYKSNFSKIRIKTLPSTKMALDIPLDIISIISGNIYNKLDVPENKFSRKLSLVSIELVKDGKIVDETKPEFDGMYFFEDVLPGRYKIRFVYFGPEDIEFSEKELDIDVDTTGGDTGEYFEGYDVDMFLDSGGKDCEN